ncbi:MAG: NADPH-dependent glutamate synthase, partial [Planctomycetota bacterium]
EPTPRERREIPAQPMPTQDAEARRTNFDEVATGYTEAQARVEAMRCLRCAKAPCVAGCPVQVDIPGFIGALAAGDDATAIAVIKRDNLLPAICGRVCPQESQCQERCTVGKALKDPDQAVAIGRLERYAADRERAQGIAVPGCAPPTGKKVAIVGSGPASLVVAADVQRAGHQAVILEAFHQPGGVLIYGIPEFRLPKDIVTAEIDALLAMGVEIRTDFVVGRTRKLHDLLAHDGFDAAFIGTGAGLPLFLDLPGEHLIGVYSANEYLTRVNLMKAWTRDADTPLLSSRRVAVIGGGNVAMDAARTAMRMGAETVSVIYRRTREQMPARAEEVEHAEEEGIDFRFLQNIQRIIGDDQGRVQAVECLRYELGEPGADGRRRPQAIAGSQFTLPMDTVIMAVGSGSNPLLIRTTPGLTVDDRGRIVVDENGKTSIDRVYAAGDIVIGAATVILAMGEGRKAAHAINALLAGQADQP